MIAFIFLLLGSLLLRRGKSSPEQRQNVFQLFWKKPNTPFALSLGLAVVWEGLGTKQQTHQALRWAPTFFEIVLHTGTAARAADWERLGTRRPQIYSQAPRRVERQQQGYYCPRLPLWTHGVDVWGMEAQVCWGVWAGLETGLTKGQVTERKKEGPPSSLWVNRWWNPCVRGTDLEDVSGQGITYKRSNTNWWQGTILVCEDQWVISECAH